MDPTAGGDGRHRHTGWWVAPLYLVLAAGLVPWIAVLAVTLPDRAVSHNYRLAWVGFDVLLTVSIGRTAWLSWRRSPFVVNVASVTAALLVVDAWFDVTTASGEELLVSCLLATFVELPAAGLSLLIARRAQDQIARTGAVRSPRGHRSGEYVARAEAGPRERPEDRDVPCLEQGVVGE
jgi:hypothetical protein